MTKLQCWNSSLPTPSVHRTVRCCYSYYPLPCSLPWPQNEQQYRTSAILPLKVPRKINIFKIHVQQYRTSELLPSKPPRKITISKQYEQQYRTSAIPPSKTHSKITHFLTHVQQYHSLDTHIAQIHIFYNEF